MCPHCVTCPREADAPPSYEAWLHSIIDTAVRNASEIVEAGEALATPSSPQESLHHKLALAKDSAERRYVRTKIHALLLQWSNMHLPHQLHHHHLLLQGDNRDQQPQHQHMELRLCNQQHPYQQVQEWRTMVSQAVPLLEEALYQQVPTLEDYCNPLLLEPHLRRILCLFHAGHGLPLLQGQYTPHSCINQDDITATPIWLDDASLEWERSTLRRQGTIASLLASETCSSRKEEANRALWNAIASGDHSLLERALRSHGDFASSRVVKRAYELISTQKRAGRDYHQEPQTERKENEGSVEVKKPPQTEKKRCRKTLRDMLKIHARHVSSSKLSPCVPLEADDALMREPSSSSTADSSQEGVVMKMQMQEEPAVAPSSSSLSSPLNTDHQTQTCNTSEQSTQNNTVHVALPEGEHEASSMIQDEREAATTTGTVLSRATAMQPGETEALTTSTPCRTSRAPLISFLAEVEDFALPSHIQTSWDKWEEPAEALDPMCCVCMVGLKGAAFIPCGHTYCRKCSRELFRSRMTCPLCNQSVTSILDIY